MKIHIPDEVVEAAQETLLVYAYRIPPHVLKAAIAAGLAAWPYAHKRIEDWYTPPDTVLILPLKETP